MDSAVSLSDRLEHEVVRALQDNSDHGVRPMAKLFAGEPLATLWRDTKADNANLKALTWCEARPDLFTLQPYGSASQFYVSNKKKNKERTCVDCGSTFASTFNRSGPRCTGCRFGSGGKRGSKLDDREQCNNYTARGPLPVRRRLSPQARPSGHSAEGRAEGEACASASGVRAMP